jgi:hypothetical protein
MICRVPHFFPRFRRIAESDRLYLPQTHSPHLKRHAKLLGSTRRSNACGGASQPRMNNFLPRLRKPHGKNS